MSRTQYSVFGGLCAAFIALAVPASAAPGNLAVTKPATADQTILVRGGHGGGGWDRSGWGRGAGSWGHRGGGWGRRGGGWGYGGWGYGYGGYPYYDDYYFDDYDYGDTCYYSRRLRARVCPGY